MNAWRRALNQVGGRYAVTWRAWLITLPLTILISSVYATQPTATEVLVWTSVLVVIHVVLGLVMLIAGLTFLSSRPRPPRPWLAIGLFAFLGLLRALLLQTSEEVLGIGSFPFSERLVFNIVASVMVFSAIAIVVDEFATDSVITGRLEAARKSLDQLRDEERASLEALDTQIVADVRERVLHELNAQDVDSARIREISDSVVREVSHELAEPVNLFESRDWAQEYQERKQARIAIVKRMVVPPPLVVVVIYQVLIFGSVITRLNVLWAVVNIVSALPTWLGLWLMRRYVSLPARAWARLVVLVAGFAAIGLFAGIVNAWMWRYWFGSDTVWIPDVVTGVTVLSLTVSAWIALVEGRENRRQQLGSVLDEQAREIADLQQIAQERRSSAARFLHGSVQNQLIASSVAGDSPSRIQQAVSDLFAAYRKESAPGAARTLVESLVGSWSAVIPIDLQIDDSVWSHLAGDESRSRLLTDVISEGLTNAVKHSSGGDVRIEASVETDCVITRICTAGAPAPSSRPGIGLRHLRDRGAEVDLVTEQGNTTLVARI